MNILIKLTFIFILISTGSCNPKSDDEQENNPDGNYQQGWNFETNGIPVLIQADYLELGKISQISKFRSGEGHNYSDAFESCRSMKHYFMPKSNDQASTIKIMSPLNGTISKLTEEWAGTQVEIQSKEYPDFHVIIFHINLIHPLVTGDSIKTNQVLGYHIGPQTWSDIAIGCTSNKGWKLVSYFDCMADSIFDHYKTRGASNRSDFIISKNDRDAHPLTCSGESFVSGGGLADWVQLN